MPSAKRVDLAPPANDSPADDSLRPDASEISLLGLVNVALRYRLLMVLPAVLLVLYAVVPALQAPRSFTAETTFMPAGAPSSSGLSGIGAQLGFGISTPATSESPDFYLSLIETREILGSVVDTKYRYRTAAGEMITGDLVQIYKPAGDSPAAKKDALIKSLRAAIDPSASVKTSIITLKATAPQPELAKQIADAVLAAIVAFNRDRRQSKSSAEVDFIADRLAETTGQLRNAENRLQQFLQENREYRMSPKLTFEQDRLAREVALRQQLYNSIVESYERAKIDRVREASVITVIENPQVPLVPDGRGLRRQVMLNVFLGLLFGLGLAFLLEFFSGARRQARSDWEEFARLRRDVTGDIRHPLRAIRRLFGRARPISAGGFR